VNVQLRIKSRGLEWMRTPTIVIVWGDYVSNVINLGIWPRIANAWNYDLENIGKRG
jgi:hypothetical protein